MDDIGFLRALLGMFFSEHRLDARRVYAAGFSYGAVMTFRGVAELPDRVVGIAPVANARLVPLAELKPPVSLLRIWGDADPLNPIAGGRLKREGVRLDRPAGATSLAQWAQALAGPEAARREIAPGVARESHLGCVGGSAAEFVTIQGLGHHWPGGVNCLRAISGPGSDAISATDLIWEFSNAHARR